MQIATLHKYPFTRRSFFASTRSVQIATIRLPKWCRNPLFASTRSVQIATIVPRCRQPYRALCLHTLRADCNDANVGNMKPEGTLPPHAPCRLQRSREPKGFQIKQLCLHTLRADCNADRVELKDRAFLFASTRSVQIATLFVQVFTNTFCFASTRSVQIATAEMHRIAICTFQNVC